MNHSSADHHTHPAQAAPSVRRRGATAQTNGAPGAKPKASTKKRTPKGSAFHREAEQQATMAGLSAQRKDSFSIDYRQPDVGIELTVGEETLLKGALETELLVDGRAVTASGAWKAVCTFGDDEGQYLELQLCISDSLRIDRQLFLSRDSQFLLLADAVVSKPGTGKIEHRIKLPVASDAKLKADIPTREWRIGPARFFPLWLPQDRVMSAIGDCTEHDDSLDMSYTVAGPGLYLPVIIDWNPRRRRAAADWSSLTVTEPARVVSPSGAAGHRLRIGTDQLVIFRGLVPTHEPRAMLGIHTWYETLFGWFKPNGDLVTLMATEAEET